MKRNILILLPLIVMGSMVVGCKTSSSDRQSKMNVVDKKTAVVKEPTFNIDRIKAKISASNKQIVWKSGTTVGGEMCWDTDSYRDINYAIKLTPSKVILVGGAETGAAYTLIGIHVLHNGVFKNSITNYIYESTTMPLLNSLRRFDSNTYERQCKGYTFQLEGFPDDGLLQYCIYGG